MVLLACFCFLYPRFPLHVVNTENTRTHTHTHTHTRTHAHTHTQHTTHSTHTRSTRTRPPSPPTVAGPIRAATRLTMLLAQQRSSSVIGSSSHAHARSGAAAAPIGDRCCCCPQQRRRIAAPAAAAVTVPAAAAAAQRHRQRQQRQRRRTMAAAAAGNGGSGSSSSADEGPTELVAFVAARVPELAPVFAALADASRQVAAKLARAGLEGLYGLADDGGAGPQKGSGDVQKKLDVVANDVFVAALGAAPGVVGLASEEEDDVLACSSDSSSSSSSSGSSGDGSGYVVVFDPLDGSRNLDSSMPTGSIWGVYRAPAGAAGSLPALRAAALQPGHRLVAAGYTLYSSATVLALSVGDGGVHGFTLDPASGGFLLSHRNLRAPPRGQVYSLNDAREGDWPAGLQRYIRSLRRGQGQNPKQYSARYVCCLVADFHRTLVDGGICMNPRSHLRLVYEGNPLAFLAEQAGGAGSDGRRRLLEVDPRELHQRLPVFLGSLEDVAELVATGDVQQLGDKKYAI